MDDWRLRGQEEYLKGLPLYKVSFPEFWQKAYDEKNTFYQMISDEAHRFVDQMQRGEEYLKEKRFSIFGMSTASFAGRKQQPIRNAFFIVQRICVIGYVRSASMILRIHLDG